ncbi:hypothetical protein [Paenibacillus alginolyticus]|uniref:hypothetical protein n=1 Tax=Paenibacillus alginolyticus TaxID=59839 RepID=UPI002DB5FB85|nr:hypothetical protein [Paenibacillus alginolyticus]MEC0147577.1 hypothetical protein [Paenibacillus alginolyticus]
MDLIQWNWQTGSQIPTSIGFDPMEVHSGFEFTKWELNIPNRTFGKALSNDVRDAFDLYDP